MEPGTLGLEGRDLTTAPTLIVSSFAGNISDLIEAI